MRTPGVWRRRRDGVQSHAGKAPAAARQATPKPEQAALSPQKACFNAVLRLSLRLARSPHRLGCLAGRSTGGALRSGAPNGDLCWPTNPGAGAFMDWLRETVDLINLSEIDWDLTIRDSDSVHSLLFFGVFLRLRNRTFLA
jgi:hypothetical protein